MNNRSFPHAFQAGQLASKADTIVGNWVRVDQHEWHSLYAWNSSKLYDDFGDVIGALNANTIYLYHHSITPVEDLFHELGHAVARRFNLIGHQKNGFNGRWEKRQARLIAQIQHGRHWSPLLDAIRRQNLKEGNALTPALSSELWAEIFMSWYLYPDRPECELIELEMNDMAGTVELSSIGDLLEGLKNCPKINSDSKTR